MYVGMRRFNVKPMKNDRRFTFLLQIITSGGPMVVHEHRIFHFTITPNLCISIDTVYRKILYFIYYKD